MDFDPVKNKVLCMDMEDQDMKLLKFYIIMIRQFMDAIMNLYTVNWVLGNYQWYKDPKFMDMRGIQLIWAAAESV